MYKKFRMRFGISCSDNRKSKIQNRKWVGFFAILVALAVCGAKAEAQQAKKVPRIGMLVSGTPATHGGRVDAFREGLRELGYVEGKNILVEYRYGEGKIDRFSDLAAELVRLKPDIIVVGGNRLTHAAKQATSTIPIVVASAGDLVGAGLVASLARPGGNVTGSTEISPDLSGKRLELLKEAVQTASRVAVLWYWFPGTSDEDEVRQTEIAARALGLTIKSVQVRAPDDLQAALAAMKRENANALVVIQGSFISFHRKQIAEFAAKNHLPSICETPDFVYDGCLMSYGPNAADQYRRGAMFVDKILKGAKPADLPVEQPMKFELVINLKTAKQIGLTIPQSVLYRADKVIK